MAQSQWYDIDMPSAFTEEQEAAPADNTAADTEEAQSAYDVRFVDAREWGPGPRGFAFNEKCTLTVKAERLVETIRTRVEGELFAVFDGAEQRIAVVSGTLDADGVACLEIPLYYHDACYEALAERPDAECTYVVRSIRHSRGANTIDSAELTLPRACAAMVEIPDTVFGPAGAVPCLDPEGRLVRALVTALCHCAEHTQSELTVCGHAASGETDPEQLSELRARAVKALLDNDGDGFVGVAAAHGTVADCQRMLLGIHRRLYYPCHPGAIDGSPGEKTTAALQRFQQLFGEIYGVTMGADGAVSDETWAAFFTVIRDTVWDQYQAATGRENIPEPVYRGDNEGIAACGDTVRPQPAQRKAMLSRSARRVELRFAVPEEQERERTTVSMAPVSVVGHEELFALMGSVELRAEYRDASGGTKKRTAAAPARLSVVPPGATRALRVSAQALMAQGSGERVQWWIGGWSVRRAQGRTVDVEVKGYEVAAGMLCPGGDGKVPVVSPKEVTITAVDSGGCMLQSALLVYPCTVVQQEIDLLKPVRPVLTVLDRLKRAFRFGLRYELEVCKDLVARWKAQYKEIADSPDVYLAGVFEVEGTLVQASTAKDGYRLSVLPYGNAIPSPVRKFIADIYLQLSLLVALTARFRASTSPQSASWDTEGGTTLKLELEVFLGAAVGNDKILRVKGGYKVSVKLEAAVKVAAMDGGSALCLEPSIEPLTVEFKAEYLLFDGLFRGDISLVVAKTDTIRPERPVRLLTLSPDRGPRREPVQPMVST